MSEQQFSNQFREYLWLTYAEKCFYCKRPLLFSDMKVDHVIPESMNSKPIELVSLKQRAVILDEFNILGYENLAPSCYGCNRTRVISFWKMEHYKLIWVKSQKRYLS